MVERAAPPSSTPLAVSQVTRYLKYLVEADELMSSLSIRGEVCEFSRSASGHLYFAIKDEGSQLGCVMFRREASRQPDDVAQLRKGISVVVHGFLTVYEPRTTCQIYVERVVLEGEGAFQRRFEELKSKLEREGLFSSERKRRLPVFPRSIALVTSPGSQAYHDVLHRLRTQCPFVRVIVAGVSVQGDRSPDEIVMALDIVNRLTDADLILVVRGGGSPEDLAAFNDERLARAIFASRIPVITGVGHETDHTIVDFVADLRAATPSLAAAAAVPDLAGLVREAAELHAAAAFAVQQRAHLERARWVEANRALLRASPRNRVLQQRQRLDELLRHNQRGMAGVVREKRARLAALSAQLSALDPLAILSRGYAMVTRTATGEVVRAVGRAHRGEELLVQVADGSFRVRVDE
jgi:exodeoxyribonuclease VII large subunit